METTGNEQKEMPFLARVVMREADPGLVGRMSFAGVLRFALQQSGFDDHEVADRLGITPGYMSKVLHGTATLGGSRLSKFCEVTQSLAPVQWHALQFGRALVDGREARIKALEAELNAMRAAA